MTSDVKSREQLFLRLHPHFSLLSLGRGGARKTRRVITLIAVGWLTPSVPPSGACRMRGPSVPVGLITPPRVTPHRGGASAESAWQPLTVGASTPREACGGTATCLAMAHRQPTSSRATATPT